MLTTAMMILMKPMAMLHVDGGDGDTDDVS